MSDNNRYNGWSNYATWRINLELFSDTNFVEEDFFDGKCEAQWVEEMVEDWVFSSPQEGGLVEDYARAFIAQVNFHEIADHINDELEQIKEREAEADQYE
mgnify:FL=1